MSDDVVLPRPSEVYGFIAELNKALKELKSRMEKSGLGSNWIVTDIRIARELSYKIKKAGWQTSYDTHYEYSCGNNIVPRGYIVRWSVPTEEVERLR